MTSEFDPEHWSSRMAALDDPVRLAEPDPHVRRRALRRVLQRMETEVCDPDPAVLALAVDPDRNVRHEVVGIVRIWAEGRDAGRGFVVDALASPELHLRVLAARCWPDTAPVEPLAAALADPQVAVRRAAAGSLVRHARGQLEANLPGAPEALRQASSDPDWLVRTWSLRAYWSHGDVPLGLPDVPEHVLAGLDDPCEIVRFAAAVALGSVGGPNAVAPLLRALADRQGAVRLAAVRALATVDPERGFRAAVAALRDSAVSVRVVAAETLGTLRDPRAIAPLARLLLGSTRSAPRVAAADALGLIRRAAAVPPLVEALTDSTRDRRYVSDWGPFPVRHAAARALGRIGTRAALEALRPTP